MTLPKISVVTPSFKQAPFLEETIRSVLSQEYPDLEYIVMDGGSTDGSVEIIRKYADRLAHWESAKDEGQAAAIRSGFAWANGEIFGWLNSDDTLAPGTLREIGEFFAAHPDVDLVYGDLNLVDVTGKPLYTARPLLRLGILVYENAFVPQQGMYWRRSLYERVGGVDPRLRFAMDFDLVIRFLLAGANVRKLPGIRAKLPVASGREVEHDPGRSGKGNRRIDSPAPAGGGRGTALAEVPEKDVLPGNAVHPRTAQSRFGVDEPNPKLKILLVSPFLPFRGVSHAGGKLVDYLLSRLILRHSVHLVTRYYPGEERHFTELRGMVSGLDAVPADGPVDSSSPWSILNTVRSYARLARQADIVVRGDRFDLCQVEFTETGYFWRPPTDLPAVLTCHDIIAKPAFRCYEESRGPGRVAAFAAWKAKYAVERRAVSRFRTVFTLSEEDRDWAGRLYPAARIRALLYPGGIDFLGLPRQEVPGRVLFVGALNRPQNIESVRYLAEKVWPVVRLEIPDAELLVVGGGLPAAEKERLSGIPGIRLAGFVESIEMEYKSASVFAAPVLSGGGIIVKILDSMAAGVPVVTTSYGNEGIRAEAGKDILVADSPEAFARALVSLLKDPGLRKAVAAGGSRHLADRFSEERWMGTLDAAYQEVTRTAG